MHCNNCGSTLHAGEKFCPGCGHPIPVPIAIAPTAPPPLYVAAGQPSGKATVSLICGLFFFLFPLAILAVVFGHMALGEIKRSAGKLIGEGRAIAGLVLGYFGLLSAVPLILIVAAVAIPNLLRARIAANEATAVGSLRSINVAEVKYANQHPEQGYTCELEALAQDGLIDRQLARGEKAQYAFTLSDCSAKDSYKVFASPRTNMGAHAFCSDQTGVMKRSDATSLDDCLESGNTL